jgi:hypothetical protein
VEDYGQGEGVLSDGSGEGDSETGWQFRNLDCCEKGETVMNIQIFGTKKSADTRKAERFFKERGIKFQSIDLAQKGFSKGELTSILLMLCTQIYMMVEIRIIFHLTSWRASLRKI